MDCRMDDIEKLKKIVALPHGTLKLQKCDTCGNYLSIGPVVILKSQEVICGRCEKTQKNVTESLYNKIAPYLIFKCKNHHSGCKTYLEFNSDHEKSCPERKIECPLCSFKGNGCQLSNHIRIWHDHALMKNSMFTCDTLYPFRDVFIEEKMDFLIAVTIIKARDRLSITVKNLGKNPEFKEYSFKLFSHSNQRWCYCFNSKEFTTLDNTTEEFHLSINELGESREELEYICGEFQINDILDNRELKHAELSYKLDHIQRKITSLSSPKLIKNYPKKMLWSLQQRDGLDWLGNVVALTSSYFLICSQCSTVIREEIHICSNNHTVCTACLKSKCNDCDALCTWRSTKHLLEKYYIKCKWENCGIPCSFMNYLDHKQKCTFRLYRCPIPTCKFEGVRDELLRHWHINEPSLRGEAKPDFFLRESYHFYWLMENGELVYVQLIVTNRNGSDLVLSIIVHEDQAVFPQNYSIEFHAKKRQNSTKLSNLEQSGDVKKLEIQIPPKTYGFVVVPK